MALVKTKQTNKTPKKQKIKVKAVRVMYVYFSKALDIISHKTSEVKKYSLERKLRGFVSGWNSVLTEWSSMTPC